MPFIVFTVTKFVEVKKVSMEFDRVLSRVAPHVSRVLEFMPDNIKNRCEEIRLRVELPLCLTVEGRVAFVCADSGVSYTLPQNPLIVEKEDIKKTLSLLCSNSVYLHENEIKQGFVSVMGGYRVGVSGDFNAEGMLISVNSLNIRIARQILNCADLLLPYVEGGLLIAGPPGCGKTTMLRDLIRQLSNGKANKFYRVCAVDSRREISGGAGVFDLGLNTDVLYTESKASGTQIALRTMFPNIIAFDEIGTTKELDSIKDCFNAGVGIITTAHAKTVDDLLRREIIKNLINSGAISYVALLDKMPGALPEIIDVKRLKSYACS